MTFKVKFGVKRPAAMGQKPVPGFEATPEAETPAAVVEAAPGRPVSRTARLLALAYYVERQIEDGVLSDYAEAARLLGMSRARMTQVMDLLALPAKVQDRLLAEQLAVSERRLRVLLQGSFRGE